MSGPGRILRPTTGTNAAHALGSPSHSRLPYRFVRPMGARKSEWITTRAYSPSGVQLWDGDHGSSVFALAVGPDGTVYQAGSSSDTGLDIADSLFDIPDFWGRAPTVTAMRTGGYPIWAALGVAISSVGIAVDHERGFVYYSTGSGFTIDGVVAKLNFKTGADLAHLPISGFYDLTGSLGGSQAPTFMRVHCDSDGNVYADSLWTGGVVKWKEGAEFWQCGKINLGTSPPGGVINNQLNSSFTDVSDDGVVFVPSIVSNFNGGTGFLPFGGTVLQTLDASVSNLASPYTLNVLTTTTENTALTGISTLGNYGMGVSPDGTKFITYNILAGGITGAVTAAAAPGGTSPFSPHLMAMSVNDAGQYVYSVHSGSTTPEASHVINGVLCNHGGPVYDGIVLADGTVIIAGQRVRRADFP